MVICVWNNSIPTDRDRGSLGLQGGSHALYPVRDYASRAQAKLDRAGALTSDDCKCTGGQTLTPTHAHSLHKEASRSCVHMKIHVERQKGKDGGWEGKMKTDRK